MNASDFSLTEHHRDLEVHFQRLASRFPGGDLIELRCEWSLFERELNEHMELEEKQLIPRFRREYPAEAAAICHEHVEIRAALAEMGISLDLHALRASAVSDFIERLRRHAQREEELFYDWAQRHTPKEQWLPLGQQLGLLSRSISAAFGGPIRPGAGNN